MNENVKPWKCPKGHVMGLVTRDGGGVRRLLLYRRALHEAPLPKDELDVMATIEGYVADVRCSICGSVRTWVPGEDELKRLVERMNNWAGHDQPLQKNDGG